MTRTGWSRNQDGYSLAELMIALLILSVGILAIARLFPSASREQVRDRMRTSGSYYAQEKVESLRAVTSTHPDIAEGRHPSASTNETVGPNANLARYWTITYPPEPLGNVARVDVVVRWQAGTDVDSVVATTYLDH